MSLDFLLSSASGPLWGLIGVVVTQVANIAINRRKTTGDTTTAALEAVNVANKQLIDGLFQQVEVLSEQVSALHKQLHEYEARNREANDRIQSLERRLSEHGLMD